jgi:predicted TIM-barrel fold metal-dependent hydrolase
MLLEMDAAGVDRAVIVPPHWVGDDNETALKAASRYPTRFAVFGRFNPKASDSKAQLGQWLKQPHMLGIRATFHTMPYREWLDDGTLNWFWEACEQLEIPVMALVPGMVRKLLPVLQRYPHLNILIPHMGLTTSLRAPEAFAHLDDLVDLARYPKLFVMVSSAPCFSREPYPFTDIAPYLMRIFNAYGSRRLLWGADRTRLNCTYRQCVDQFQISLDFLTSEDKEWVLGKTLAEVLKWPEVAPVESLLSVPTNPQS